MVKQLFREKSLERIESPEQLNDYTQVASPGVWLALAGCLLILLGLLVWSVFGTVEERTEDGTAQEVRLAEDAALKEESRMASGGGGEDASGEADDGSILQSFGAADRGGFEKGMKFARKDED